MTERDHTTPTPSEAKKSKRSRRTKKPTTDQTDLESFSSKYLQKYHNKR